MKKFLISGSIVALLLPGLALAAFNDATLNISTVLNVGGANLIIDGSTAVLESIAVDSSSFTFTLQPGSSIEIQSLGHLTLATNAEPAYIVTNTCGSTESRLKLTSTVGSARITITPGSACSGSATGSSSSSSSSSSGGGNGSPVASGGGGGGGGGAIVPQAPAASSASAAPAAPAAASGATSAAASGSLTSDFGLGAKGSSVEALQSVLEAQGFLTMPAGVAKGTYGALTRSAVRAYQKSKGISQTGFVGPQTRAALNADLGQ